MTGRTSDASDVGKSALELWRGRGRIFLVVRFDSHLSIWRRDVSAINQMDIMAYLTCATWRAFLQSLSTGPRFVDLAAGERAHA
jgi:hypothetical protein